ncbi:MAG: hypothetical protein NC201_08050 [Prevotella sp.]|nr:hypothetical protein [Bacteroides sp.]MCM1367179.1 hypothetical protein [Prevotella sp.]MCM1437082.1 hypothetical protein [Prevotella sp.]
MIRILAKILSSLIVATSVAVCLVSCDSIVDDRIPALPVSINLGDAGMWNTYGVAGFGVHRYFIKDSRPTQPAGYLYNETTYTGFGGVLLIGGMDPYTSSTNVPLAYDLSCPVEVKPEIRVKIDPETYHAVCPKCGSVYDVTMLAGAPIEGPAAAPSAKYRLQNYSVLGTQFGGYVIMR